MRIVAGAGGGCDEVEFPVIELGRAAITRDRNTIHGGGTAASEVETRIDETSVQTSSSCE